MIHALRVIRAAAELHLRFIALDRFMLLCVFVQPFFVAVTVMFMLRERPDFMPVFVVVGSGLTGIWSVALFNGVWVISGERGSATLELVVGAPVSFMVVMGGRLAGAMVLSLASMISSYLIGAWLFGYEIAVRDPLGFAASFGLALAALWSIGVLLAPLAILWRAVSRFLIVLEYPVYIFGGFLFPILLLPGWTHPLSYVLPPYWAAVALHGTSSGALAGLELLGVWAALAVSTVAVVVIARPLYGLVLVRARRDGTLALT